METIRKHGEEQPYIPLGIFKLRIPIIHYKWEWSECLQAILMCSTCLGAIPILTEVLGVSFEIAWSMVIINGFLYTLHTSLGDPVVPGWITPSIPITTAFLMNYAQGTERVQALIAVQLMLSFIFLIMGTTGFASKLINIVPNSIKSGILLGAGIAAVTGEFKLEGGRFGIYPIAITIGIILSYYILFSEGFANLRKRNKVANKIGEYGMLPAILICIIIAPLVKEIPALNVEVGTFIKIPDLKGVFNALSPFKIGFPTAKIFLSAIPTALMVYIIAFGDFVTSKALIAEADQIRTDESIDFNANRSNIISAIRNFIMALVSPYVPLCGPLWAAVTAAISERYKDGREAMDSIFSGMGTFRWMTFISVSIVPIVTLVQPVLPIALSLTLIVQGFVCTRLAMNLCDNDIDRGIAGVMGAVLAVRGASMGLIVGVLLYFILTDRKVRKLNLE